MHETSASKKIILSTNLQGFFFDGLTELNQKSLCPLPGSVIYYSSDVLNNFAYSHDFFEKSEGKIRQKILGMKLLEATQCSRDDQKKIYKEVGDMSLMICGYFSESVKKKIVDTTYYAKLGKMSYSHLNTITPNFMDIPDFYGMIATCFESLTALMTIFATKGRGLENPIYNKIMKDEALTSQEILMSGIVQFTKNKAS